MCRFVHFDLSTTAGTLTDSRFFNFLTGQEVAERLLEIQFFDAALPRAGLCNFTFIATVIADELPLLRVKSEVCATLIAGKAML
jgi:hypothetical protein